MLYSYYYPGVSNNITISPSTFATLAVHPNIVGTKLSHGNISHHTILAQSPAILNADFKVFTGLGQQLLPVLSVGGAGAIDGLAAIFPKSVVKLYALSVAHKYAEAAKLQYAVSCAEEMIVEQGTIGVKEAVARVAGFGDSDGCRLPLSGGMRDSDKTWSAVYRDPFQKMVEIESSL